MDRSEKDLYGLFQNFLCFPPSKSSLTFFSILVVMTLLLGVYPAMVTDITGASVGKLITDFRASVPAVLTAVASN